MPCTTTACTVIVVALIPFAGAAFGETPSWEDLAGEYDCVTAPGCDPSGSEQKLSDPYVVTTTRAYWRVATTDEGVTVTRLVSSSGSAELPRVGSGEGSRWDPWTSSQETTCLCKPATVAIEPSPPPGALTCVCSVRSRSSQYTVRIAGVDSTYPETDSTRETKGALEPLPEGRMALKLDGVRRTLKRR